MESNREYTELQLQRVIGLNLKSARQRVARMSMQEVCQEIWGDRNKKSRLSEIETGARMPTVYQLLKFSILYGVSLDFIFGMSNDIERDLECSRAGIVVQGLRETALEIVERIGHTLAKQVSVMPKMQATLLLDAALEVIKRFRENQNDIVFHSSTSDALIEAITALDENSRQLSTSVARHNRIMELNIFDHIERMDREVTVKYATDIRAEKGQQIPHTPYLEEGQADI